MQIDANFAEADIGSIRAGQPVKFTVDAYPNRNFQGEVRLVRLNPTNQQNVITYDVIINVSNPEQILMPGMTAYVSLAVAERKDVLIVPNAALRFKPADAKKQQNNQDVTKKRSESEKPGRFTGRVYVLKNGQLQPVTVKLGITDNRNTEIISGDLKAGDQLVTGDTQATNTPASSAPRGRMF